MRQCLSDWMIARSVWNRRSQDWKTLWLVHTPDLLHEFDEISETMCLSRADCICSWDAQNCVHSIFLMDLCFSVILMRGIPFTNGRLGSIQIKAIRLIASNIPVAVSDISLKSVTFAQAYLQFSPAAQRLMQHFYGSIFSLEIRCSTHALHRQKGLNVQRIYIMRVNSNRKRGQTFLHRK